METLNLKVPNMQSSHCQSRVSNAVKTIANVQIQSVEAGEIAFSYHTAQQLKEVLVSIEKAGYAVEL